MLPDFLIAGAYRSGTTTLRRWLVNHPDVDMSALAEPSYFAFGDGATPKYLLFGASDPFGRRRIDKLSDYVALFSEMDPNKTIGECSPEYLREPGSAKRIAAALPDCRIILSLRHPADRLISDWKMCTRDGVETLTLREALGREGERIGFGNHYSATSRYSAGLAEYFEVFDRSQILVLIGEEWMGHPASAATSLARLLEIDRRGFGAMPKRRNASGVPRSLVGRKAWALRRRAAPLLAHRVPQRLSGVADRQLIKLLDDPSETGVRDELLAKFQPEVDRIEELLGRRIEAWHS